MFLMREVKVEFLSKWFSKDTSRARNLALHEDEHKKLKNRKRFSYFGLATSALMLPVLYPVFGPVFAIATSLAGCLGACTTISIYDAFLTQFKKQHNLPVSKSSEFIFNQLNKLDFVREIFACKNEADIKTTLLKSHFNILADRHETMIRQSKEFTAKEKSKTNPDLEKADNDITYYERALRTLSPSSNLIKAGMFAVVVFTFARRVILDAALGGGQTKTLSLKREYA